MILTERTSQKEITVDGTRRNVLIEYYLKRGARQVIISEIWHEGLSVLDRVDDAEVDRIKPELYEELWNALIYDLGRSLRAAFRNPLRGY